MEDLKKFYDVVAGELDAGKEPEQLSSAGLEHAKKKKPGTVQRKEQLENQLTLLQKDSKELIELSDKARVTNEDVDPVVRGDALQALIKLYYKFADRVRVKLTEPLLDEEGNALKQFAMKRLDPEKADAQWSRLEKDLELAHKYYPDLKLESFFTGDDPPIKVALVRGIEAEEFNAVVMAERARQQFEMREAEIRAAIAAADKDLAEQRAARKADADLGAVAKVEKKIKEEPPTMALH